LAQTLLLCKVNQVKGKLVPQKPTILIVDRNPNVRKYLKREFGCEGYHIQQAENCRKLLQMINDNPKLDLIIIDPDLPDVEEKLLLRKLQSMQPRTQVVIHTLIADYLAHCSVRLKTVFVEKDGNSIERLKHVVAHQLNLKRHAPDPFLETASGVGRQNKKGDMPTLEDVGLVDCEKDPLPPEI
jgi:DNA-binding NtrC family response regulator